MYSTEFKELKEFTKSKISYICDKKLLLFSVCNKCGRNKHNRFKNTHRIRNYFLKKKSKMN